MNAVEFTTELGPDGVLLIPHSAAKSIPTSGTARVIVLIDENSRNGGAADQSDANWHDAAYRQFLADDDAQDDIYESCR
jgi:hypothetical protein